MTSHVIFSRTFHKCYFTEKQKNKKNTFVITISFLLIQFSVFILSTNGGFRGASFCFLFIFFKKNYAKWNLFIYCCNLHNTNTKTRVYHYHCNLFFFQWNFFLYPITCFCAYSQNKRYYLARVFCLFVLKPSTLLRSLLSQRRKQKCTLKMQRWHSCIWRAGLKWEWSQRLRHMFSNNSIYINDGLNASFASVTLIRPLLTTAVSIISSCACRCRKAVKIKLNTPFLIFPN